MSEPLDEPMPWYAKVGAGIFLLIAVAGVALITQRSEWGAMALQEKEVRDGQLRAEQRQRDQEQLQRQQAEAARLNSLRNDCLSQHAEFEQTEAERYDWYLRHRPMNCETNRGAWAFNSPSTDRSISTIHWNYQRLRESCAEAIDLPNHLNGRSQEEAEYVNCYGRPRSPASRSPSPQTGAASSGGPVDEAQPYTPPQPAVELQFSDMVWRDEASMRDIEAATPRRADADDYPARVRLRCSIGRDGRLECRVISEQPLNAGFGQAALRLAREFRAAPATRSGIATAGAEVELPFRFDPPRD